MLCEILSRLVEFCLKLGGGCFSGRDLYEEFLGVCFREGTCMKGFWGGWDELSILDRKRRGGGSGVWNFEVDLRYM